MCLEAMTRTELAYFGKPGSFTHLVAKKITLGSKSKLVSKGTVQEVFEYVKSRKTRAGIVPIENSSGGMIPDTVDNLVSEHNDLVIQEEYSLNVRLALLGKKRQVIKKIYSHFAPLDHCAKWLKKNYPDAAPIIVESTTAAAMRAAREKNAAAIAPQSAAKKYKLDVIYFPINAEVRNLTQFFVLGHESAGRAATEPAQETSLSVVLKNKVGSLYHFLKPFADNALNLKRIMSRNIIGQPNTYIFFVGVEASIDNPAMKVAMEEAHSHCSEIRVLGSYPVYPPFES